MDRRTLLEILGTLATVGLAGCAGDNSDDPSATASPTADQTGASTSASPTATDAGTDTVGRTDTSTTAQPTATPSEATPATDSSPTPPDEATDTPTVSTTSTETDTATDTPTGAPTATPEPTPSPDDGAVAQTVEVAPDGSLSFSPTDFEIETGDVVRWTWDSGGHNVRPSATPDDADWTGTAGDDGTTYSSGHTHEYEFTVAGAYEYYCGPHRGAGMTGTFTVR